MKNEEIVRAIVKPRKIMSKEEFEENKVSNVGTYEDYLALESTIALKFDEIQRLLKEEETTDKTYDETFLNSFEPENSYLFYEQLNRNCLIEVLKYVSSETRNTVFEYLEINDQKIVNPNLRFFMSKNCAFLEIKRRAVLAKYISIKIPSDIGLTADVMIKFGKIYNYLFEKGFAVFGLMIPFSFIKTVDGYVSCLYFYFNEEAGGPYKEYAGTRSFNENVFGCQLLSFEGQISEDSLDTIISALGL